MRIVSGLAPGALQPAKLQPELSREASQRLKWFDFDHSHAHNPRLTGGCFGISPQTFYRWKHR